MDPNLQPIADYISQHRATYYREAIDRHLLDAGHSQSDIDAAWAALDSPAEAPLPAETPGIDVPIGEAAPQPKARPAAGPVYNKRSFWVSLAGVVVVSYAAGILYGIFWNAPFWPNIFLLMSAVQIVTLIVGGAIGRTWPFVGQGLMLGVLVTIVFVPLVVLGIFVGICTAILTLAGKA